MEIRILIERDLQAGMFLAEDVAAASAVVPALEQAEAFLAGGAVADRGVDVCFPVVAGRRVAGQGDEVAHVVDRRCCL